MLVASSPSNIFHIIAKKEHLASAIVQDVLKNYNNSANNLKNSSFIDRCALRPCR